jgi:hypothetical protein
MRSLRSERVNFIPAFANPSKDGAPQGLRLDFEVTCLSGVVLRRTPSIAKTRQETEKGRPPATNAKEQRSLTTRLAMTIRVEVAEAMVIGSASVGKL